MEMNRFTPGEKVMIGNRPSLIVRRHGWKKLVWYVNVLESGYRWLDDKDITKIDPIPIHVPSEKKLAHERNANNRRKHPKDIRRDFLMLE